MYTVQSKKYTHGSLFVVLCCGETSIYFNIEAERKWPPISWQHFVMHFREWKYVISINISLMCVPNGLIN